MNLQLFFLYSLSCLFISGLVFFAYFKKYIYYQQYGNIPRSNIDNFALYVLENFEKDFQKEIEIPISPISGVKDIKSSSQSSQIEIEQPKSFPISLFLDMEIFIEYETMTLRNLLEKEGWNMIPILAKYHYNCNFIKELVDRIHGTSIHLHSSKHFTRYQLIRRLPRLFRSSEIPQFSLDDWKKFIELVKFLLKYTMEIGGEEYYEKIVKYCTDLSINEEIFHIMVPYVEPLLNKLRFLAYSKKEMKFGKRIFYILDNNWPFKNSEPLSGIKELDEAIIKNNRCILKTLSMNSTNFFVTRLVKFIIIYRRSYGLNRFLKRIHQLKGLDSEFLLIILEYFRNVPRFIKPNVSLDVIFGLPEDQIQILYEFLGIAKQVRSCPSKTQLVRNSLFKLGKGKRNELFYNLAESMFSFFLLNAKYENSIISFQGFVRNLQKDEYLSEIPIFLEKLAESVEISNFLSKNENNLFSIFANGVIMINSIYHRRFMYFFSVFVESYLGITTDVMFVLEYVKCPTANWLFFTNLIKAHKSQKFDFFYLYELFDKNERFELVILESGKDFKPWCELLLVTMKRYVFIPKFLEDFSSRSLEQRKDY